MGEHIRYRKPRNPETDPNCEPPKPTISSILTTSNEPKKKKFTSATFRGLGCTASSQVSVPAVIRTSANWEAKKLKKKRLKTKKNSNQNSTTNPPSLSLALSSTCVGVPDVWCGPGMGLATDVDCVVSTRPARPKVDGLLLPHRERPYTLRRMVTPDDNPFIESDAAFGITRIHSDVSSSRHNNRHVRHTFREGLAEIVMLQNSLLMGGRSDGLDRYRDLRLDVDSMSYEELLELGERIGYVSTGLGENEISQCVSTTKVMADLSSHLASDMERKCSICQEEYEGEDETGKLECGHLFHIYCIKQWLGHKSSCPICKTSALPT